MKYEFITKHFPDGVPTTPITSENDPYEQAKIFFARMAMAFQNKNDTPLATHRSERYRVARAIEARLSKSTTRIFISWCMKPIRLLMKKETSSERWVIILVDRCMRLAKSHKVQQAFHFNGKRPCMEAILHLVRDGWLTNAEPLDAFFKEAADRFIAIKKTRTRTAA